MGRNIRNYLENYIENDIVGIEQNGSIQLVDKKVYSWEAIEQQVEAADCIIHLAGLAHDANNTKVEEEYYQVNTELTKRTFKLFLTSSAKAFIFFSTVKAVADFSETPLLETVIPNPTSIYGKSKQMAEEYILDNLPNNGRKVYIIRPCMIHGPKPKGNLVALYNYLQKGLPYPFGNLSNNRSYLSINNLNFILGKLIESDIESGIYHMADDQPLSTTRIVELIGEAIHNKLFIVNLPKWMIVNLGQLGSTLHLPVNNETIKKLTANFLVSNEKIKKELNVKLPVSAEEGMRYTLTNIK